MNEDQWMYDNIMFEEVDMNEENQEESGVNEENGEDLSSGNLINNPYQEKPRLTVKGNENESQSDKWNTHDTLHGETETLNLRETLKKKTRSEMLRRTKMVFAHGS